MTIAGLVAALVAPVHAETLRGNVVGIADGDTVTVLDSTLRQHKVRLAGIDAPEKGQPFGNRSRQELAKLVFHRQVAVEWHKKDRYHRLVGVIRVGDFDVAYEQVRAGWAWHYRAYAKEQRSGDRVRYAQAEDEARSSKRGLWLQAGAEPPWEYRARRRAQ
jgi:endonuclease YncB( thermonuclease family)